MKPGDGQDHLLDSTLSKPSPGKISGNRKLVVVPTTVNHGHDVEDGRQSHSVPKAPPVAGLDLHRQTAKGFALNQGGSGSRRLRGSGLFKLHNQNRLTVYRVSINASVAGKPSTGTVGENGIRVSGNCRTWIGALTRSCRGQHSTRTPKLKGEPRWAAAFTPLQGSARRRFTSAPKLARVEAGRTSAWQ